MTIWLTLGGYEYEYVYGRSTGWCRCRGGRLADGRWPEFNLLTGARR